ncbi:MAG TPA: nodulation protein NfeD [Candidatus Polarisedimenticolia bacterium]|jgi:membrane-bound serine protease (ClpP class)|nr:nodulation protein NfeD [Candidatus Polarisedimenticolia bacterium]
MRATRRTSRRGPGSARRFVLACAVLGLAALGFAAAAPRPGRNLVLSLDISDAIQPITAQYVVESLRQGERQSCSLVILNLETPGGYLSSTEVIVKAITSSKVPVAVFVSGSQAASAGFFITIASDVAAMAPGTRFGASHPVTALGSGKDKGKEADTLSQKAENDAAAWVRSLAENRGRNVSAAEDAVRLSRSFTEKEALKSGLIDLVVPDEEALLRALDGRIVRRFDGRRETLRLEGAKVKRLSMSGREKFLSWIANPAILFFLLALGAVGLYVEFTHPGMIFPGVVGAVALLCFAYATSIIPINYAGLLLIVLGIVLFLLEIKVTSYGMLTIGGAACLLLGGLMLFRTRGAEGIDLPLWTVGSLSLSAAVIIAFLTHRVIWAHGQKVTTGEEGLVGEEGEALTDLDPEGRVFVHGEYWSARSRSPIRKGSRVKVLGVQGMMLDVEERRG